MHKLGKYSFGIGDRFGCQGGYQLEAFFKALDLGVEITPVWNKSFREHQTIGSEPPAVRLEADEAVREKGWDKGYLVDADHITIDTVDAFIPSADFFTIDVANMIGVSLNADELNIFKSKYRHQIGEISIDGLNDTMTIGEADLEALGHQFYKAAQQAAEIYQHIKASKGDDYFAIEVSMDEVELAQTPVQLYFILQMLAEVKVPVDTIAPKFTGRFNKGVDYEGNLSNFEREFEEDLLVINHAINHFGLPKNLKLSVHTGSDKFSLYPIINRLIRKHGTGLHLKTAGTTWLEELIGLAEAGGTGLDMAKTIYRDALNRYEELTGPYATVLNIRADELPGSELVTEWSGQYFVNALRHDQSKKDYNASFRQLLHTAYKIAAEKGEDFLNELRKNKAIVGKNVCENIFDRHIKPLFVN